jgi:hypothetical protein
MKKIPVTRSKHHPSTLAQTLSQALVHVRRGAAIAELAIEGSDPAIGVVFLLDALAKAERILEGYAKRKR